MRTALILSLGLLAAGSARAEVDPWAAQLCALEASVPRDAGRFMSRHAMCMHWGGEEPYDAARRKEIARETAKLRCSSLEADEARLRRKYATKPMVLAALDRAREEIAWPACKDAQPV